MRESPIAHASGEPEEQAEAAEGRKVAAAAALEAVGRGTPADAATIHYRWDPRPSRGATRENQDPVSRASQVLLTASSLDYDSIARSNAFDLWTGLLEEVAENALTRSAYFRQVLGLLLVAVRKRDLADFSSEDLAAFRTVMNILHSPSVVEADTRRAANALAPMRSRVPAVRLAEPAEADDGDSLLDELLSRA